ncbi:hypothetical protein GGR02_003248 [Anoxybacillus voinovskiensis]|uniref:Uncharacterized protein n=1 Tax=Anoxybacteroides voinovskiense TaxID=230470 RepID=A0A840DQQ8_9BACL|nr:hypothetical protein [Anoxybacillus voinovskiensis]MBB4075414.1 hypothetical protein [Anoxybacillus voinovskiensis]GGJ78513.1 hypothetical protein GCM10008982_29870 [Anoxybacillus voinovskiensis]
MERKNWEKDIARANSFGAKEDGIHVSNEKEGYDLRDASEIGKKQFQEK